MQCSAVQVKFAKMAFLNPETGLLLEGCTKLNSETVFDWLQKCENNLLEVKRLVIENRRAGDIFLIASLPEQPLKVTETNLSFKSSKTFQKVKVRGSDRNLVKNYYDHGVKPGDCTKFDYKNAFFKKQTVILEHRRSTTRVWLNAS